MVLVHVTGAFVDWRAVLLGPCGRGCRCGCESRLRRSRQFHGSIVFTSLFRIKRNCPLCGVVSTTVQ